MCAAASYDDNENALYGTVGIFAKKYWSRNQSKFYEIGNIIDANDRIPFAADKEILKIRDLNIQEGLISAKFKILRNGETYIKILQKEKNEVIKYSEDSEEVIVTQIYYFLKDCLHKHRHHSQSTDSILNIYALDNEKDQDLQQKQWKLDVLYTLYRKVINRRRNGSTVDLSDSLGVLAYAESFYKIFKKDLQGLEDKSSYNRDEIRESINSSLITAKYKSKKFPEFMRSALSITLTFAAVVIAFSSLLSLSDTNSLKANGNLVNFVSFILDKPAESISIGALISLILIFLLHYDYLERILPNKFLRDTVKILVSLRESTLNYLIVFLFISFLFLMYWQFSSIFS